MKAQLDNILIHMKSLKRVTPDYLQPGLGKGDLKTWEKKFDLTFTSEIETIYQWRNGTKKSTRPQDVEFFPGFYFLSIQESFEIFNKNKNLKNWNKLWFPIFGNGAGDYYVTICAPKKRESSEIIGYLVQEKEQIPEYQSLKAMMETFETAYQRKVFFIDKNKNLEMDDDKYQQIAHRFNPRIELWEE